jgi:hypothetical protein
MLRSEPDIVAGLAKATLEGKGNFDWDTAVNTFDAMPSRDRGESPLTCCSHLILHEESSYYPSYTEWNLSLLH